MFRSNDWRSLTDDGRMLVVYLLACGHSNLLGCYYLPIGYAAEDLEWDDRRTKEAFKDCEDKHFLTYHAGIRWVHVHKFLKYNNFENGNVAKAGMTTLATIPEVLRHAVAQAMLEFASHLSDRMREQLEAIEAPSKGVSVPAVSRAEPEPRAEKTAAVAKEVKEPKSAKPEADTAKAWESYTRAFGRRYPGSAVLRNASTNSAMANFVKAVGKERAPQLAEFYVQHNDPFFVRSGHCPKVMVGNAQRLMNELSTGVQASTTGRAPAFVEEMQARAAEASGRFSGQVTTAPVRPSARPAPVQPDDGVIDVEPIDGQRSASGY